MAKKNYNSRKIMDRLLFVVILSVVPNVYSFGFCNDRDVSCGNWALKESVMVITQNWYNRNVLIHVGCAHTFVAIQRKIVIHGRNAGECLNNTAFMFSKCPTSCGICKPKCYDKTTECREWSRSGNCAKNPEFMLFNCPLSCGVCEDRCVDTHESCPSWAANNQCGDNPGFMLKTCPQSCEV